MIDLKTFEQEKIKELLLLVNHIFFHSRESEKVREVLNLINLSMRRIVGVIEEKATQQEMDVQIQELKTSLKHYIEATDFEQNERIARFINNFTDLFETYYKYVDKKPKMVLDLCNVFRIITEVYLRTDPSDKLRKSVVHQGMQRLVDDWLSGKITPPSTIQEIPNA